MNILQRITATLTHTVNNVVTHVENHDAVVEASLKDTHAAAARARVRLSRLRKDGEHMRRKHQELLAAEKLWAERAVATAAQDEARALECLKRRNGCRAQLQHMADSIARHEQVESEVGASVERIESRLQNLTQQRNQMRSRHSAADALRVISRIEDNGAAGIEDVFDRWEMQIAETEYAIGATSRTDALDHSFTKQEDEAELRQELQSLLAAKA